MIKYSLLLYLEKRGYFIYWKIMYAIGFVLYLLSWCTLHSTGLAEQNVLYEAVVATI